MISWGEEKKDLEKKIAYLFLALLVVAFIVAVSFGPGGKNGTPRQNQAKKAPVIEWYNPAVPKDIEIPDKGAAPVGSEVAIPKFQAQAAPGTTAQLRKFAVKAENSSLQPKKIIVYQGDITHIDFSAVDKGYDFSIPAFYGVFREVRKGEMGLLEFQANTVGQFDIVCQSCGGKKMGILIVAPR